MMYGTELPVLYLPANENLPLTTMGNHETIPWEPHGGFTVQELGVRLRSGAPYAAWLEEHNLELWGVDSPIDEEYGSWYVLVTPPFRDTFTYDKEVLRVSDSA